MKAVKEKIEGYICETQSRHNPIGISRLLKEELERGDAYYLATRRYYITESIKNEELQAATKDSLEKEKIKQEFDSLIKEWISAVKYKSLESQQINHPAFLRIIAVSDKVLPFVFEEFSKRPFMAWLRALPAIVGQDVASEAKTFPEALKLWIEWGKENGYLPK